MEFIFDNFYVIAVIGVAFATWLKNRGENAEEEEAERRAREEMARHLEEVAKRPVQKTPPPVNQAAPTSPRSGPPPIPQKWDTRPQAPQEADVKPPPLKEIFKEVVKQLEPVPGAFQQPKSEDSAYNDEPAPWEEFEYQDASHSEITEAADPNGQVLNRQRKMQERLAQLKAQAAEYKGQTAGARETQRRASGIGQASIEDRPPIAEILRDRSQTRRAIILNEVLGKPIALR